MTFCDLKNKNKQHSVTKQASKGHTEVAGQVLSRISHIDGERKTLIRLEPHSAPSHSLQ